MLRKTSLLLFVLCLMLIPWGAGAERVLFTEDFTQDGVGAFPSKFTKGGFLWGDITPVYQVMDNIPGGAGNVLNVLGQELGSQGYMTSPVFDLVKGDFIIEFDIMVPEESASKYDAGFYVFANEPFKWPPFINIYVGAGKLHVVEGSKETMAATLPMGQFHHITLRSNLETSKTLISINNVALDQSYDFRTKIAATTPRLYFAIFWKRDNRPDTYWDNFKVWQ